MAFRLLHNDTFPSWGFSIKHGATSIWERWDGWTPEKGFQDPGMNSFAHYSFGAVYQWMVENIGGIRSDGPAYKHITIAPRLDPNLSWAKTSYKSIRGEIATSWTRNRTYFDARRHDPRQYDRDDLPANFRSGSDHRERQAAGPSRGVEAAPNREGRSRARSRLGHLPVRRVEGVGGVRDFGTAIRSPALLTCQLPCVICVISVTPLSRNGLRRRFSNDLRQLMRHGRRFRGL